MSTPGTPKLVMVPVKRYDINLTLHDILTPLTQMSAGMAQGKGVAAPGSELAQHVQALSDLAGQLRDVVARINAADPTLLAPTQAAPPRKT